MAQVLVRGLDKRILAALKKRAAGNRRSLQGELKSIMESAARRSTPRSVLAEIDRIRRSTRGKIDFDSTQLIREDRDR